MKAEANEPFLRWCILGAIGGVLMAAGDWLLGCIPDIAQAMRVPIATWMSVMSQSSTNTAIVIWCIAAAIYGKKHIFEKKGTACMKTVFPMFRSRSR